MTRLPLLTLSVLALLLGSCKEYAYYQSPFQGATSSYKTMPMQSQGINSAFYASGALVAGGANYNLRDGVTGFTGSLYRSQVLGSFRAFYGVDAALGGYRVRPLFSNNGYTVSDSYPNDSLIYTRKGTKFYGGWGASGGIYLTQPFNNGGEWRIVGAELSWQNEYGRYLSFRKDLPDTATNLNNRHKSFITLGFHTDMLFKVRRGAFGVKFGPVLSMRRETISYSETDISRVSTGYWSTTFHLTKNRTTGYMQINFGSWAANVMFGVNCRL